MAKSNFEKFIEARLQEQKQSIIEEARHEYLANLPDYTITLEQFIKEMQADGLWDSVSQMSLADLANHVNPPAARTAGKRMTKAEKERILERIPEFLENNPWSKKREIGRGVGADPKKLNGPLRELLDSKKIKKQGEKGGTVYAVRGEKTKPE